MSEQRHYVKPPKQKRHTNTANGAAQKASAYLHPDYRKRKLAHLIIVVPVVWCLYYFILLSLFNQPITGGGTGLGHSFIQTIIIILQIALTFISAYFYPFSLFWYKESFIGRLLNNMVYFGGFWAVIGRIIATLIGGIIIAGLLAPITGPLTLRKCRQKGMMIGDAKDFN